MTGIVYMLLTALCWSFMGVCIKGNTQSFLLISAINCGIGLILNVGLNRSKFVFNKTVIIAALAQFMMTLSFTLANQFTSVGNAIVLQNTSIVFVIIYQSLLKKKIPKLSDLLVICLILSGVVIFFIDSLTFQGMIGNLVAIFCGAVYGLQFYENSKENAHQYTSLVVAYLLGISLLAFDIQSVGKVTLNQWVLLIIQGLICNGLGNYFFTKGIQIVNPLTGNMICMLEILFSPCWAYLFFREAMGQWAFIGAVIIVVGIALHLYEENIYSKKEI